MSQLPYAPGGTTQGLRAADHDQENAEEQVPPEPGERPAADEVQGQPNVGTSGDWGSRRRQAGSVTEEEDLSSLPDQQESGNQDQWGDFERFMRYREEKERYETNGRSPVYEWHEDHFGPEGRFRGEDDLDDRTNAGPAPA